MPVHNKPTIIPIASGKGGVGKSLFAASLAITLAEQGHKTVAIDLDLGGSNLHTYLGMPNTNPGVGDYLKRRLSDLHPLIVDTKVKNLRFLPGDGKTPFMANIPNKQRFLMLDRIQKIPARFVILDLGAGTSINTMNFFGMANRGVLVTTMDTPAMMNALSFLRNFMFANIISLCRTNKTAQKMLLDAYRQPTDLDNLTVRTVYGKIAQLDPQLAKQIEKRCSHFSPRMIFNMGDHADDLQVAAKIESTIQKNLSMQAETVGLVYYDEAVRKAVRQNQVFLPNNKGSLYARCLANIASRLSNSRPQTKISLTALMEETRRIR